MTEPTRDLIKYTIHRTTQVQITEKIEVEAATRKEALEIAENASDDAFEVIDEDDAGEINYEVWIGPEDEDEDEDEEEDEDEDEDE